MRTKLETVSLGILAAVFFGVALLGLFAPRILFEPTGVALETRAGLAEIRAAYCGLFGASAFVFFAGARQRIEREFALNVAVLILGGFLGGRVLSWAIDGTPIAPIAIINLVAEGLGFVVVVSLWWHRRKDRRADPL